MKNNIDELLKQQFSGFAPEAPDVWSGIEQGLGGASASSVAAAKAGFFTAKMIAAIAGVAVVAGAVVTYIYVKSDDAVNSASEKIIVAETQEQTSTLDVNTSTQEMTDASVSSASENVVSINKETRNKTTAINNQKRISENKTVAVQSTSTLEHTNTSTQQASQPALTPQQVNTSTQQTSQPALTLQQVNTSTQEDNKRELSKYEIEELAKLKIPNAFSPDGDGLNDNFEIVIENEEMYSLTVFNRNEKVIFQSTSKDKVWDGTNPQNGEKCQAGDYAFIFRYKVKGIEQVQSKSGILKLIR